MVHRRPLAALRATALGERALRLYRMRRLRLGLLIAAAVLVLYTVLGFFAAPPLLKSQLQSRLGTALGRPLSIATVRFNPFTLRLELDAVRLGDAGGTTPLAAVDQLVIDAAWSSLFHRAPVLDSLTLQHPQLYLTRLAPQRFNISDLIARFAAAPSQPDAAPARFALANISVHNGDFHFDDRVLGNQHRIDRIELGIPFIANLPADIELFVQPLLSMRVDGSAVHLGGQTKPFASSRESVLRFDLDHLQLPRYLGYLPLALPVAIPSGELSGQLEVHFLAGPPGAQMRLQGALTLDDFALTTASGSALLELAHGSAQLTDVQPLLARYRLGAVSLDGLALHYHQGADGHSNFDALRGAPSQPAAAPSPPTDVRIDSLNLSGARLDYADLGTRGDTPGTLELDQLQGNLRGLSTVAAPPADLALSAQLAGGQIRARGKLDLAGAGFRGTLQMDKVALAPLQPLLLPTLQARIDSGSLDANAQLQLGWGHGLALALQPSTLSTHDVRVRTRDNATPLAWRTLTLRLAQLDLAARQARVDQLLAQGLALKATRLHDGSIDLNRLLGALASPEPARHAGSSRPVAVSPASAVPASAPWHWSVAELGLDDSDLNYTDLGADKSAPILLHAERYRIQGLSDDWHQPLKLALSGKLGRGRYQIDGKLTPQPLTLEASVVSRGIDIAPLQSMISVPLNVRIGSALLSLDGRLRYADRGNAPAHIDYRGQASLGRVRVQDKLSGDDFLRWHSLAASKLQLSLGQDTPTLDVGTLALSDFYARVIVNANGRLNLADVVANPSAAPVSVTRAEEAPKPAGAPVPTTASAAPKVQVQIGQITLARGQLNYTDNFIKPNYTANVTALNGNVGAFGSAGGAPAPLLLQGKLDDTSPVNIAGSINPLTPTAFLDITAKADDVQLTRLSPYSGKYAGYPITGGRLSVDVHYQLDQQKLTADNHLFIEQLTFGDRIDAPGVSHLPVKLALALLKNSQGQIDVHLPVSGSLDDPQFSMGSLIWHALGNLIARAATSPFRLLASIGGGDGASPPDLGYVEFAPGSAVLDATAQTRLTQLEKLLGHKPALNLDITGRVDPAVDEPGLRQVMVDERIRQAKADDEGDKADLSTLTLTPDEYQRYLRKVYRQADFAKPKNAIGLTKSQPSEDMQQWLASHMPVDAAALKALAERRADAVRQALASKLDPTRLSLQAPKLDAGGIDDQGKSTRVDFGLH
jgi:uncharacterized protein involved in outer membrane biogenesis